MPITTDELAHRIFEDEPASEQERLDYKDEDEDESYYDNEDYEPTNPITDKQWNRLKMAEEPIFYVYVYIDPTKRAKNRYGPYNFTHEPFYVGKGHGKRSQSHLKAVLKGLASDGYLDEDEIGNLHKKRRIAKILRTGKEPIIRLLAVDMREQPSFSFEVYMIAKIGRRNKKTGPLTNLTDGGEGVIGAVVTEETKYKQSCARAEFLLNEPDEDRIRRQKNIRVACESIPLESRLKSIEKQKASRDAQSPEKKQDIIDRRNATRKAWPEEKRKEVYALMAESHRSRSKEEKKRSLEQQLATKRGLSDEHKQEVSNKHKATLANKSEEEKQERITKLMTTVNAYTPEHKKMLSDKQKAAQNAKSPEEKKVHRDKIKATRAARTQEQIDREKKNRGIALRKRHAERKLKECQNEK